MSAGEPLPPDIPETAARNSGFSPWRNGFTRHWRGELSLAVSFWVNGLFASVILPPHLFGLANRYAFGDDRSLKTVAVITLFPLLYASLIWIWSAVGIWRSASRSVSRGGSRKLATLARLMVILGVGLMVSRLARSHLPQLGEYALIAAGYDPIGEIHYRLTPGKRTLILAGMLREGASSQLREILDANPEITLLSLRSNGGRLLEARRLAALVRERKLDTFVGEYCKSACTLVFLAGKERAMEYGANIGFHQPSLTGLDSWTQRKFTREMLEDYRAAGMPNAFIHRLWRTPPDRMWYPDCGKMREFKIVTRPCPQAPGGAPPAPRK
ncbi:MAG: hypothetical protein LBD67_00745 [Candidatus Accumulibacter sp.]|jgi:hypothetical protein|nr:hypothetical protein [Accumulibacter sp.]